MEKYFIEIHWTCGSLDEARQIARFLVKERLVACAQIIPWIESVFMWDNKQETAQESKVIFKTRSEYYDKVKAIIEEKSKYEVPEILQFRIERGNQAYLDWMEESTPLDFQEKLQALKKET